MRSADLHGPSSSCRSDSGLRFRPHFLLKNPRLFRTFLDLSGFGFLRLACGTAVKSVRISISVSLLVRVRDEPVECLPWTRRTGVCRLYPLPGYRVARSERRWPRPRELRLLSKLRIPSWLMPLRDRSGQSTLAGHKVTTAVKVRLRIVGTCGELHPSLSLVCPWTLLRSWEHLPFSFSLLSLSLPLSFFPSFFPLFTFLLPWVSLDAFVIAGSPSFLVCPWTLAS